MSITTGKIFLAVVLGIFFLGLGLCKIFIDRDSYADLFGPVAQMAKTSPPWLLKFIGVIEILGGLGILLNFGSSTLQSISLVSGVCLTIHMCLAIGAHVIKNDSLVVTLIPVLVGLLCVVFIFLEFVSD